MKRIENTLRTYKEKDSDEVKIKVSNELPEFEVIEGQKVDVYYWVQWPTYDFIFGVPQKGNPAYGKEFGFFQFRKTEKGKTFSVWNCYLDQAELTEMAKGFARLLEVSKTLRPQEWEEFLKNLKVKYAERNG